MKPQVSREHYGQTPYKKLERWVNYWHQMDLVRKESPASVLEVGVGAGIVSKQLKSEFNVTTLDIDPALGPDIVGSITRIPIPDKSVDVVLAAEILEHLPWPQEVSSALKEMARVSKKSLVISVPHAGFCFMMSFKFPLIPKVQLLLKLPYFYKTHVFDGEHYWEIGKKGYPIRVLVELAQESGLRLKFRKTYADDPMRIFFVFGV